MLTLSHLNITAVHLGGGGNLRTDGGCVGVGDPAERLVSVVEIYRICVKSAQFVENCSVHVHIL